MPPKHSNMGLLNFEPVRFLKRLFDLPGDLEIGRQLICNEALRQWNQPARIAHDHGLIGWGASPELIEHALKFCQPSACIYLCETARVLIPEAHAQELE